MATNNKPVTDKVLVTITNATTGTDYNKFVPANKAHIYQDSPCFLRVSTPPTKDNQFGKIIFSNGEEMTDPLPW